MLKKLQLRDDLRGIDIPQIFILHFPVEAGVHRVLEAFNSNHLVEYAEPYYFREVVYTPNDPDFNQQYALNNNHVQAELAWDYCQGDPDVTILITDTGIDMDHPDLVDNLWVNPGEDLNGNGTQDAFYDDPAVLYISTHQHPLFPGTGSLTEAGDGAGEGATINIPLPVGCGDDEYRQVFEQIVAPVARRFRPRFIMVSAGYDLHWLDSISLMQVSTSGIAKVVKIIKELADELCRGRLVFLLEGGYHLGALADSTIAHIKALME